jgi:hypothetical protein
MLELPANILTDDFYNSMFECNSRLSPAPELPSTISAKYCFNSMLEGCPCLSPAPELPSTILADAGDNSIAEDCLSVSVSSTLELPDTTFDYNSIFECCTYLSSAPELPDLKLVNKLM